MDAAACKSLVEDVIEFVETRNPEVLEKVKTQTATNGNDQAGWTLSQFLLMIQAVDHALTLSNDDDEVALRKELETALAHGQQEQRQLLVDTLLSAYHDRKSVLRQETTRFDLGIPRLVGVQAATASSSALLSSLTRGSGSRRKHLATVSLRFDDDNAALDLICDLQQLEQFVSVVRDAHAEAGRALADLKGN